MVHGSGAGSEAAPASHGELLERLRALVDGERDRVANMANAASLLYWGLNALSPDSVNWLGFYVWSASRRGLVLGPFHGQPACIFIAEGRGVCGAAAARRETLVVPDVHAFPGHIACDARSASEIVVPLLRPVPGPGGEAPEVLAVLDADAPRPDRFGPAERELLEAAAGLLASGCDWPSPA
eukprot:tig00000073_g1711.t1